jgi:hypothetical protein
MPFLLEEIAIREQLERVLAHAAFKNSRRSRSLLRYIVEHRGECGDGHLKERTLGVEVFGRAADYDTNTDPVVRIAAGEVRKRLAQYYHEAGHETELRIEVPLGSYRPEFHSPAVAPAPSGGPSEIVTAPLMLEAVEPIHVSSPLGWWAYALAGLAVAALMTMVVWNQHWRARTAPVAAGTAASRTAVEKFWDPILNASGPIQIGLGRGPGFCLSPSAPGQKQNVLLDPDVKTPVGWWDALVAARVAGLVQKSGRDFRLQSEEASLKQLSQGPAVLIGANNNDWVMKLTGGLRFHFINDDRGVRILDREAPGKEYTSGPGAIPGSTVGYALVVRLSDATTGQTLLVLAGAGSPTTYFAGDLATNPSELKLLANKLPAGWEDKNIEVLVSGQSVNGDPGAPAIVTTYVW